MNIFKNLKGHFCTITHHKMLVMKTCFKVGLYKQGLLHDLSKYTPMELFIIRETEVRLTGKRN